jgi:hypothetical protein
MAAEPRHQRAVSIDSGLLRDPPALPAGSLPTGRRLHSRPARLLARYRPGASGFGRLLRVHRDRRRRSRPDTGHVPTLLGLLGVPEPADIEGISHAQALLAPNGTTPVRDHVYTAKTYHDSFDPIRAIRTKNFSYIENYAQRPLPDLPRDIEESPSGQAVKPLVTAPRPERELYDLCTDPTETNNLLTGNDFERVDAIAADLAVRLHDWRQKTGDVIPSDFAGSQISARYIETYLQIHRKAPSSRSAIAADRGAED